MVPYPKSLPITKNGHTPDYYSRKPGIHKEVIGVDKTMMKTTLWSMAMRIIVIKSDQSEC